MSTTGQTSCHGRGSCRRSQGADQVPHRIPAGSGEEQESRKSTSRKSLRFLVQTQSSRFVRRCDARSVRNRTSASIPVKMMPVKAMRRPSICIRSFVKADLAPALLGRRQCLVSTTQKRLPSGSASTTKSSPSSRSRKTVAPSFSSRLTSPSGSSV